MQSHVKRALLDYSFGTSLSYTNIRTYSILHARTHSFMMQKHILLTLTRLSGTKGINAHTHTSIYTHTYIYVYIYMYVYKNLYICIYLYIDHSLNPPPTRQATILWVMIHYDPHGRAYLAFLRICIYIYTYMYIHIYIYTYI